MTLRWVHVGMSRNFKVCPTKNWHELLQKTSFRIRFFQVNKHLLLWFTLPETDISPENWWLENETPSKMIPFQGSILVSGRVYHKISRRCGNPPMCQAPFTGQWSCRDVHHPLVTWSSSAWKKAAQLREEMQQSFLRTTLPGRPLTVRGATGPPVGEKLHVLMVLKKKATHGNPAFEVWGICCCFFI